MAEQKYGRIWVLDDIMELPYHNLGMSNARLLATCKRKMKKRRKKKLLLFKSLFVYVSVTCS